MTVDLSKAKVGDTVVFANGGKSPIIFIEKFSDSLTICFHYTNFTYKYDGNLFHSDEKILKIVELIQAPEPLPDVVEYCNAYETVFGFLDETPPMRTKERLATIKLTFNPNTKEVKAEVVG